MATPRGEAAAKLAIIFVLMVGFFAWLGGMYVDGWTPDATGSYADAWISGVDVAPGDAVGVHVKATNAADRSLKHLAVGFAGAPKTVVPVGADDDEAMFAIDVPEDAQHGANATLLIDADVWGRTIATSFEHQTRPVHLTVPVRVRAPGAVTIRKVVDVGIAAIAWLACAAIAWFAFVRIGAPKPPPPLAAAGDVSAGDVRWLGRLLLLVVIAFGALGRVVFAWPLLRTTSAQGPVIDIALAGLWALAPGLGAVIGLRRAGREARWLVLRVRPVMGKAHMMPSLDRPCDAKDEGAVRDAIGATTRLATGKVPPPWRVEQLDLRIHDDATPEPIVARLAALYGPVEWALAGGAPAIVEGSGSPSR